jgi:hypothetical protein
MEESAEAYTILVCFVRVHSRKKLVIFQPVFDLFVTIVATPEKIKSLSKCYLKYKRP